MVTRGTALGVVRFKRGNRSLISDFIREIYKHSVNRAVAPGVADRDFTNVNEVTQAVINGPLIEVARNDDERLPIFSFNIDDERL